MLKMVDGTGIIGVDMVCPLGGAVSPPQPPNYDKVEMEGMGSLTLQNSLKAPIERLELIGNSVQLTTTGINLLPYKVGSKINSLLGGNTAVFKEEGIEITIKSAISTSDGDIYFLGNNKSGIEEGYSDKVKAGDYTILSNSKLCTFYVVVWRNGTSKIIINNSDEQMIHFTVLDGDKIRLFLRVKQSIDTEKAQIMLCKHTDVNLPYEPYTGLKPSPSPEYPQEIKSAGKWNEASGKYLLDVKVIGKNLIPDTVGFEVGSFNYNTGVNASLSDRGRLKEYIPIVPGKKYLVTVNGNTSIDDIGVHFLDINRFPVAGYGSARFISPLNAYYVRIRYKGWTENDKVSLQLQDTSLDYEPYTEQTVQIALNEPLRGIGEYKDMLTKDGVTRKIKKIALDGSEGWLIDKIVEGNVTQTFVLILKDMLLISNHDKRIMCDKFKFGTALWANDIVAIGTYSNKLYLNVEKDKTPDLQTFKTWLSQNPLAVDYVLAEPITEPLPESVQTQLRNLHTENGTTHVFVDSGEVPCGIKLTYRKEK